MTVGGVTSFQYNGTEYSVPTSKDQRKQFASNLEDELEALDGITFVGTAGATQSYDGIDLEIEIEFEDDTIGRNVVVPNLRSLSQRIRNTIDDFVPASSYEVSHTPTALNADDGLYRGAYYIVEVRFY